MFGGRFSSSMGIVGIDIGSRSIKMLQVRDLHERLDVVGAAEVRLRTDFGGQLKGPALAERLRLTFSAGGFTGRRCIVSVPRSAVHVQPLRLPKMPDGELHQAAVWEASERFKLDRDAMEMHVLRTGAVFQSGENREEILLVAVSHQDLNNYLQPLLDAGLRPIAVDTDFAAVARLFSRKLRRESDQQHVHAVLDVGASGSSFMILRGDQIAFCKQLGMGGERFNQAVAEHLEIDADSAASLRAARIAAIHNKETTVRMPDRATDRAVFEAVRPLMCELTKEIVLCLRYFGVTFRGKPPQQILLTGGDGLEPHFEEIINQGCKVSVAYDDSDQTLTLLGPMIRQVLHRTADPTACWSAAAGLSLRTIVRRERSSQDSESLDHEQPVLERTRTEERPKSAPAPLVGKGVKP